MIGLLNSCFALHVLRTKTSESKPCGKNMSTLPQRWAPVWKPTNTLPWKKPTWERTSSGHSPPRQETSSDSDSLNHSASKGQCVGPSMLCRSNGKKKYTEPGTEMWFPSSLFPCPNIILIFIPSGAGCFSDSIVLSFAFNSLPPHRLPCKACLCHFTPYVRRLDFPLWCGVPCAHPAGCSAETCTPWF